MINSLLNLFKPKKSSLDYINEDFFGLLVLINQSSKNVKDYVHIKSLIRIFRKKWSKDNTVSAVYTQYNETIVKAFNYTLLLFIRESENGNVKKGAKECKSSDS